MIRFMRKGDRRRVVIKDTGAVTGWDKFLRLLHIFGLLVWDATAKFTRPVPEI